MVEVTNVPWRVTELSTGQQHGGEEAREEAPGAEMMRVSAMGARGGAIRNGSR